MATDRQTQPAHASAYAPAARTKRLTGGGTTGNERLTAATGFVLIAPLAVIGVTILRLQPLLSVHLFVGMLLIPPVLLKMTTTGYRFIRYYTNSAPYVRKGAPPALLRMVAPMVLLSTLVVFGSGVALLFVGPSSRDTLLPIHKVSFFVWLGFTGVHVLGHLIELPELLRADYGGSAQWSGDVTGRSGRVLALSAALVTGVVLAILVIPEFPAWVHASSLFHEKG
ncbi:MAG: hypothetical protein H0X28_14600 [Solirubrobacterales bacterium]|nr:hypothetical protein [Solirubrobacterales bacterium]